jgi:Ras-related protein Rab-28
VDHYIKRIENLPGGQSVALQIWDIGGQSISSKMMMKYLKGAQAVILAYDLTDYQSFADLDDWMQLVVQAFAVKDGGQAASAQRVAQAAASDSAIDTATAASALTPSMSGVTRHSLGDTIVSAKLPLMVLMANKMDIAHQRAVKVNKHKEFKANNHVAADFFVSAKNGDYVTPSFTRIAATLAGVALDHSDILKATKVIPAQIVNHQANDPEVEEKGTNKKGKCTVM